MTIKINKGVVKPEPIQAVAFAPSYDEAPTVAAEIRAWLTGLNLGFRVAKSELKTSSTREDVQRAAGVYEAQRYDHVELAITLVHEKEGYGHSFLLSSGDFLVAYLRPQGRPYPTPADREFAMFPLKVVRGYRINFNYDLEPSDD